MYLSWKTRVKVKVEIRTPAALLLLFLDILSCVLIVPLMFLWYTLEINMCSCLGVLKQWFYWFQCLNYLNNSLILKGNLLIPASGYSWFTGMVLWFVSSFLSYSCFSLWLGLFVHLVFIECFEGPVPLSTEGIVVSKVGDIFATVQTIYPDTLGEGVVQ